MRWHEKRTLSKLAYRGVFFDMVTYGECRTVKSRFYKAF